jgi:hypothetical protein
MSEADSAHASHIAQWLDAEPEMHLARLFVAQARDPRVETIEAIAHALHASLFGLLETQLAQVKLAWWLDELAQAPRHPLTRHLQSLDGGAAALTPLREVAASIWRLAQRDSIETLDQLLEPLAVAADGVARARRAVRTDHGAIQPPAQAVAAARLLGAARDWPRFARPARALLPLQVLAALRIDRAAALEGAAAAQAAQAMFAALDGRLGGVEPAVLRGIDGARVAAAQAWARGLQATPQAALEGRPRVPRVSLVLALWRVGRRG